MWHICLYPIPFFYYSPSLTGTHVLGMSDYQPKVLSLSLVILIAPLLSPCLFLLPYRYLIIHFTYLSSTPPSLPPLLNGLCQLPFSNQMENRVCYPDPLQGNMTTLCISISCGIYQKALCKEWCHDFMGIDPLFYLPLSLSIPMHDNKIFTLSNKSVIRALYSNTKTPFLLINSWLHMHNRTRGPSVACWEKEVGKRSYFLSFFLSRNATKNIIIRRDEHKS